ncbi:MAG: RNA methyltransferase, partial [Gemmataceae bacterium]|nr:RNA methyltransferase [Gemmataceae bacterium]MDW8265688.1 RNA methyltransferase [Gemmataceae bacterium]
RSLPRPLDQRRGFGDSRARKRPVSEFDHGLLHRCRVVLVRPQVAGNIGATARVMRNMGLSELVLVAPQADPLAAEARQRSTHGEGILRTARIVADLEAALAECVFVAATAARVGGLMRRQSVGPPDRVLPRLIEALAAGPAALVFGPEPTGLTDTEVTRCHYLIHIPTDPSYPALNLAHAVAICLYELRRAWLGQARDPKPIAEIAPFADLDRMFTHLRAALEDIHFLYGPKAESLMHALRHLISRAGPSPMEVDLLHGLARQIRWYAAQYGPDP